MLVVYILLIFAPICACKLAWKLYRRITKTDWKRYTFSLHGLWNCQIVAGHKCFNPRYLSIAHGFAFRFASI